MITNLHGHSIFHSGFAGIAPVRQIIISQRDPLHIETCLRTRSRSLRCQGDLATPCSTLSLQLPSELFDPYEPSISGHSIYLSFTASRTSSSTMPTTDPSYFQSVPWCAALLAEPEFVVAPSRFGRPMRDQRGEFFTTTLANDSTIKACVYQSRKVAQSQNALAQGSPTSSAAIVSEVRAFIDTSSGINGFPGVAHGGFVAAIIDEVMGFLINSYVRAATENAAANPADGPQQEAIPMTIPGSSVMTAELTTKYRRPVPSGEPLLVRAWIDKVEGRKMWVSATIEAEDREVLTEGLALFIALKPGVKAPLVTRRAKM
jgi:acyl-coenzyme A thioesterase THEM4